MNWLLNLIKPVGDYLVSGQKIRAAKVERKDELKKQELNTKLEGIRAGVSADIAMDTKRGSGWMDDVSFGIFLTPAVLAFCPAAVDGIKDGFVVLANMPDWYQYALGGMLVSVWGYRRLLAPIMEAVIKNSIVGRR